MTDLDPFETRRDIAGSAATELGAAGFGDAREIGRGGFGVVYQCRQASLDRTVAVKVLTADIDEENRSRFLREQRAAGRLTGHPNIVNILEVGELDHGRPYIVMPFYSQGSLHTRIRRHGPLTEEDVLRVGVKIASALEAAHELGILHRDVKPANILLSNYGDPALTDFGIARIVGGFETTSGVVSGSPAFLAPEVIAGAIPDRTADVYGLGATLFAAATGHTAFERLSGEQLVAQFVRIHEKPVPNPRDYGIADDISSLIEGAMASDPGSRPTVTDLGRQLRHVQRIHGFHSIGTDDRAGQAFSEFGTPRIPAKFQDDPQSGAYSGLPLDLTSFVDRRIESAQVRNLLKTARMVTLTGMGGVGKTRLALRVARRLQPSFTDGVFLVELGELRDESLLVDVVAEGLGVRDCSSSPLLEVLKDHLATRKLLLVLDNCEQVLNAVAALTDALLRASSGLRMLLTSREPVGISGEVVLMIAPLVVPNPEHLPKRLPRNDAMTLFAERGATVVPGFEVTEENQVTVAQICQKLDGLPVAIELAAARLRAISPTEILQRLTDSYALLTGGSRDSPSRQQALRVCIGWSYDLCEPQEQQLWSRLSVFAGSFELNAAEQICGRDLSEYFLDAITSLVDKSILIREKAAPVTRFRMLDTVRDFGKGKIEASVEPELRKRYRDWYEQLACDVEADWIGPGQLEWTTRLIAEQPNLRQALEFCISDDPGAGHRTVSALFPFWTSRGLFSEARRWTDRLSVSPPESGGFDRAKAVCAAMFMAGLQGDLAAAGTLIDEGRMLANQTEDVMLRRHLAVAEGYWALFVGEPQKARRHFENALASQGTVLFQIIALDGLGITCELLSDTEQAIDCYERVLTITEASGETVYRAYALWALAVVVWRHGKRTQANDLLKQALDVGRNFTDRLNISMCLEAMAWIAAGRRDAERAVVLASAAEQISQSVGSPTIFFPGLLEYHEQYARSAQKLLSKNMFEAAHSKGRVLSVGAAVAFALDEQIPELTGPTPAPSVTPTKREIQVADLVAEGLTNREIAARLTISPRTAQGHVEHLLVKLDFTSRAQIAVWATESRKDPPSP
jgi:non-specific serine/threonine protein kinase